jgi:hypothetical protein
MAKKKPDLAEIQVLEGRAARIRMQTIAIQLLKDYLETKAKHPSTIGLKFDGTLGLRGLAVMTARAQSGRLYTEEQVERYSRFIEGLEELGIITLEPTEHLPLDNQDPKYRMIRLNLDAVNDAKTRIQNQP